VADDELTLEKLNELDDKQRKEMMRQTVKEIVVMLANAKGFKRLVGITDEEWQEAVDRDGGIEGGAA
jgi:hypothetical protein